MLKDPITQILMIEKEKFHLKTKYPMRKGDRIYISNVMLVAYSIVTDLKTKTETVYLEVEEEMDDEFNEDSI